ncbi:type II toxin-antitoxin system RelE/ParE family toxin [Candidatus Nomurabacteria bacterium]|nr:type II toxin-antitoxin system RelE/ParE family toxin [Candidatus Nomurabacteria bacterium]
MPNWSVEFTSEAEKDLAGLDRGIRLRIIEKLEWLEKNFDATLPSILTADFRDYFKLRVGDWRVFYQVDWGRNLIIIRYIGHRSKSYKKR